jgi:phosphatidylinositol kinase/protein kinase (PI-3  family)
LRGNYKFDEKDSDAAEPVTPVEKYSSDSIMGFDAIVKLIVQSRLIGQLQPHKDSHSSRDSFDIMSTSLPGRNANPSWTEKFENMLASLSSVISMSNVSRGDISMSLSQVFLYHGYTEVFYVLLGCRGFGTMFLLHGCHGRDTTNVY